MGSDRPFPRVRRRLRWRSSRVFAARITGAKTGNSGRRLIDHSSSDVESARNKAEKKQGVAYYRVVAFPHQWAWHGQARASLIGSSDLSVAALFPMHDVGIGVSRVGSCQQSR